MLEERKVQKAKITLMRNPKFALLSGVLMVGKTSVVDNVRTACTNGRDEKYGRKFVKSLRDQELNFLVAHENGHKMYRHLTTWKKLHDEDHRLANQACDYVINLMLKDLDPTESVIAMPRFPAGHPMAGKVMGLVDERFRGMNSKQVFDILKQEKEEGGSGEGDGDDGMDDHDWDEAKDMTEEEKKELEREIDQAIRQGMMARQKIAGAGSGEGGLDRELAELLEPKVNWREVLRDFVKSTCNAKDASSWRKVNRRFLSTGMYMPTLIGEKVGHLVIAVDTSGSVGDDELAEFLSEVKGIAEEVNPACVDLLYWGSSVVQHETYGDGQASDIIASTRPKSGGGTSPSCISEYLKEKNIKPECVIILTDGCVGGDWGSDWTAPTLWCIVGDYFDGEADNGKTIYIKN
jgi:predicted metal-dependent peptidase